MALFEDRPKPLQGLFEKTGRLAPGPPGEGPQQRKNTPAAKRAGAQNAAQGFLPQHCAPAGRQALPLRLPVVVLVLLVVFFVLVVVARDKPLKLLNTFWVYIIPAIVQPFNIILVKTFMESLPPALQEAAEIDGAGVFRIFWQIILPTSTPILATIAIFAAVGQWNSFQDTLIYVTDQKLYSLQYLLYTYINQANSLATMMRSNSSGTAVNTAALATQQTPTSIRMTVSVIVVLPILFVYPIFQKYFVKGIMIGAVKG